MRRLAIVATMNKGVGEANFVAEVEGDPGFGQMTATYMGRKVVPVDTLGAHNAQMHKLGVSARSEDPE